MNKIMKNVLITGANKGLGYGMMEALCKNSENQFNIFLGARDLERGQKAYQTLKSQYPNSSLQFQQIEIANKNSHENLINHLKQNDIKIDVLVNNAAIQTGAFNKENTYEQAKEMLNINYKGTADFTQQIIPQLSDQARIIFMGASLGALSLQGPKVQKLLSNPQLNQKNLDDIVDGYLKKVQGKQTSYDWNLKGFIPAYSVSKAALHAWIRFILPKYINQNQTVQVICPGWCKTDLGTQKAPLTVEQGIKYAVNQIIDPDFQKNMDKHLKLYKDGKEIKF